jgi:hypothetical protein
MNPFQKGTVSLKNLSSAVDQAVKTISDKKIQFEPGVHIGPGNICGKVARELIDLKTAEGLATQITTHLSGGGAAAGTSALQLSHPEPVVLAGRNWILCGFVEGPIRGFNAEF